MLHNLYQQPLALLTDLYELTMAYGYLKAGVADREAAFHLFFRENPFGGGFAVAAGLANVVEFLEGFRFDDRDLVYLASLVGNNAQPLFDEKFLGVLRDLVFRCDVDAVPEGTVVFPYEPLLRVTGPLLQSQILETALLNMVNFQTLIATKAARVTSAAAGDVVLEFGLRRAQGIDGGLSASRAAYIGGCHATSNVLAGRLYGIPVKGTHAHSWVMCFDDETEAFRAYAGAMPNNCVFLVDTYDTLEGVRRAVEVGRELRRRGYEMAGIRLDSGDLARLSVESRKILDEAGFPNAAIVASSDLDEYAIADLKARGAAISIWGVGTRLATAYDQPALGGVYKLSAVRLPGEPWQYRIKLSEQMCKMSNPGVLQVRRYANDGRPAGDVIYDRESPIEGDCTMVDPANPGRRVEFPARWENEDLLVPIFRGGKPVYDVPDAGEARRRARRQLASFPDAVKRLADPGEYSVGLEQGLYDRKTELIQRTRGFET